MELLNNNILLTKAERRDLKAPSRCIAPRLLHPIWEIAIRKAQSTIAAADNLDRLEALGLVHDVEDSAFIFTALSGADAELRLARLRNLMPMVVAIDIETLPAADIAIMTQLEFDF